jgi:hypothetical protein
MRCLKKKDTPILTGYQIFHNYVRPHMGLDGQTPAERCGIKVEGDDRWLTLIQNAERNTKRLIIIKQKAHLMRSIARIFRHRLWIAILLIVLTPGFATGFYTLYLFQKEPTSAGYIIAVISITLSSSGMITLFGQLIKQKHEEESTLKLEFEGINSHDSWYCLIV